MSCLLICFDVWIYSTRVDLLTRGLLGVTRGRDIAIKRPSKSNGGLTVGNGRGTKALIFYHLHFFRAAHDRVEPLDSASNQVSFNSYAKLSDPFLKRNIKSILANLSHKMTSQSRSLVPKGFHATYQNLFSTY